MPTNFQGLRSVIALLALFSSGVGWDCLSLGGGELCNHATRATSELSNKHNCGVCFILESNTDANTFWLGREEKEKERRYDRASSLARRCRELGKLDLQDGEMTLLALGAIPESASLGYVFGIVSRGMT